MKSFCLCSVGFRGVKIITEEYKFPTTENCTWEVGKKLKGSQGQTKLGSCKKHVNSRA